MGFFKNIYQWLFRSLANQLLVTYISLVTISLFAVSIWALFMIKSESINDLRNSLEVEAVNLSLEIDNDLALDSEQSRNRIKMAVDRHANKLGVSITVVNDDGHVLADSGGGPGGTTVAASGENISNQSEINDALAGVIGIYERKSSTTNSNWFYIAYPDKGEHYAENSRIHTEFRTLDIYHEFRISGGFGGFEWRKEVYCEALKFVANKIHR